MDWKLRHETNRENLRRTLEDIGASSDFFFKIRSSKIYTKDKYKSWQMALCKNKKCFHNNQNGEEMGNKIQCSYDRYLASRINK